MKHEGAPLDSAEPPFHVVASLVTEQLAANIERATWTYEIRAADERPVPYTFATDHAANVICGFLNRYIVDVPGLLKLLGNEKEAPSSRE